MDQKRSERGGVKASAPDALNAAPTKGLDVTQCINRSLGRDFKKPRSLVWAERRAAYGLDDEEDRAEIALGRVLAKSEPLLAQAPPARRESFRRELSRVFTAGQAEAVLRRLRGELRGELGRAS